MKNLIISSISLYVVSIFMISLYDLQYSRIDRSSPNYGTPVTVKERYRQIDCLAENIYYEAAGENAEGKIAVAQVTLNRSKSGKFPSDICKVIHQSHQFSWTMDKPKSLVKINQAAYYESKEAAKKVLLEGERLSNVGNSTYYHTTGVNPSWNKSFDKVAQIGVHVFYEDN